MQGDVFFEPMVEEWLGFESLTGKGNFHQLRVATAFKVTTAFR
jgi:hypothetical protein